MLKYENVPTDALYYIIKFLQFKIKIPTLSYNERQRGELFLKFIFDKVLYMFRTRPLSIIRSISTLYTRNRYLAC
jgi:hypothetical protein